MQIYDGTFLYVALNEQVGRKESLCSGHSAVKNRSYVYMLNVYYVLYVFKYLFVHNYEKYMVKIVLLFCNANKRATPFNSSCA